MTLGVKNICVSNACNVRYEYYAVSSIFTFKKIYIINALPDIAEVTITNIKTEAAFVSERLVNHSNCVFMAPSSLEHRYLF